PEVGRKSSYLTRSVPTSRVVGVGSVEVSGLPHEGRRPPMSTDRLTYRQIAEADLDDFRPIFETIRATFDTGSFAVGLDLVGRIGALAEAANHHPDVTLT